MPPPLSFRFETYTAAHADTWNRFVATSPNATFLFDRGFMDYHADRFTDASLLVHQGTELVALLPAHRIGDRLSSHGGLSYGGLLWSPLHCGAGVALPLLQALGAHLAAQGIRQFDYKTIPSIYHQRPAEEDRYALWRCGAELVRRDVLSVIGPQPRQWPAAWPGKSRRRITQVKLRNPALVIAPDDDWEAFWPLLDAQLQQRHGTAPTHSAAELRLLASRFPEQITLQAARLEGRMIAGLVLFDTPVVLHAQYMAATALAYETYAHRMLIEGAMARAQAQQKWFDFGNSNEDQGRVLNDGLVFFKEGFGATTVVHDFYRWILDAPDPQ